jgi:hypothetical protein
MAAQGCQTVFPSVQAAFSQFCIFLVERQVASSLVPVSNRATSHLRQSMDYIFAMILVQILSTCVKTAANEVIVFCRTSMLGHVRNRLTGTMVPA